MLSKVMMFNIYSEIYYIGSDSMASQLTCLISKVNFLTQFEMEQHVKLVVHH